MGSGASTFEEEGRVVDHRKKSSKHLRAQRKDGLETAQGTQHVVGGENARGIAKKAVQHRRQQAQDLQQQQQNYAMEQLQLQRQYFRNSKHTASPGAEESDTLVRNLESDQVNAAGRGAEDATSSGTATPAEEDEFTDDEEEEESEEDEESEEEEEPPRVQFFKDTAVITATKEAKAKAKEQQKLERKQRKQKYSQGKTNTVSVPVGTYTTEKLRPTRMAPPSTFQPLQHQPPTTNPVASGLSFIGGTDNNHNDTSLRSNTNSSSVLSSQSEPYRQQPQRDAGRAEEGPMIFGLPTFQRATAKETSQHQKDERTNPLAGTTPTNFTSTPSEQSSGERSRHCHSDSDFGSSNSFAPIFSRGPVLGSGKTSPQPNETQSAQNNHGDREFVQQPSREPQQSIAEPEEEHASTSNSVPRVAFFYAPEVEQQFSSTGNAVAAGAKHTVLQTGEWSVEHHHSSGSSGHSSPESRRQRNSFSSSTPRVNLFRADLRAEREFFLFLSIPKI